jgi:hypothetical protein
MGPDFPEGRKEGEINRGCFVAPKASGMRQVYDVQNHRQPCQRNGDEPFDPSN